MIDINKSGCQTTVLGITVQSEVDYFHLQNRNLSEKRLTALANWRVLAFNEVLEIHQVFTHRSAGTNQIMKRSEKDNSSGQVF